MREDITRGKICLDDEFDFTYCVADIEYLVREDESFQYTIEPNYSVIQLLPSTIFQGIPGIDLDLRKERYVRKNIVPVFISERTPGENREDLWELLETCDMDYLNRLEWLIRTDLRYSGDPLYADRIEVKDIEVDSLKQLGVRSSQICRALLEVICAGGNVFTPEFIINDENRREYYSLLMSLYCTERKYLCERRKEGVQKSAERGNYKGRSRIQISEMELQDAFEAYKAGRETGDKIAEKLNISKSTFLRRYREYAKRCK